MTDIESQQKPNIFNNQYATVKSVGQFALDISLITYQINVIKYLIEHEKISYRILLFILICINLALHLLLSLIISYLSFRKTPQHITNFIVTIFGGIGMVLSIVITIFGEHI